MRYFVLLLFVGVLFACKKEDQRNQDFAVTNTWECRIGGVRYGGTIDTSFLQVFSGARMDTVIHLTGTSDDGKSNLTVKLDLFRTGASNSTVHLGSGSSYLLLDTGTLDYFKTDNPYTVQFEIEGLTKNKLKGNFSGKVRTLSGIHDVTDGKVSLEFGRGSGSPKLVSVTVGGNNVAGPVISARHKANCLVLDALDFGGDTTLQLHVRTGAALKPGTYRSTKGEVGLQLWRPSITTHYVSDVSGDLTVTIESVSGNVVAGRFAGTSSAIVGGGTATVSNGFFRCRVASYTPGEDLPDGWSFSEDNRGQFPFTTVGGNVTSAIQSQANGKYNLTINGITDRGASSFRLKLSSFAPFTPKIYTLQSFSDSVYLATLSTKYFNANSDFFIRIDTINAQRVVGGFYGKVLLSNVLYGSGWVHELRKGSFSANF